MSNINKQPSILIVGCGSLGGSLAGHLAKVAQVSCLDSDRNVVRNLKKKIRAADSMKDFQGQEFDLTIVATKCNDVRVAVETFAGGGRTKAVLFLQNGDFSLGWASRLLADVAIYRGVTTSAVQAVRAAGFEEFVCGAFYLGAYSEDRQGLPMLARIFRKAGMRTVTVDDYRSAVWAKLIFSAVMNPLPILSGSDYSILRKDKGVNRLVMEGIGEGKRVAAKMKIPLAFDPLTIVRHLRAGNFGDFRYKGSMQYDFINGRPLELEFITGEVVRQARRLRVNTPVLDTIYTMTLAMEKIRVFKG